MFRIHTCVRIVVVFLSILSKGIAWGWFSSSPSSSSSHSSGETYSKTKIGLDGVVAKFSMKSPDDQKAMKLLDEANRKMGGSNPCWLRAYGSLFSSCSEIYAEEERRSRLAWDLTVCFQKDSGRSPFPSCGVKSSMMDCLQKLNNDEHKIYLEFYLETNAICYQLQSKAFSIQVEGLVNDLKDSAQFAEEKLESIEEKSSHLIQTSDQLQESVSSIDVQTNQISETLRNMLDHVNSILTHSKELQEQAQGIATAQTELLDGQDKMKDKLEEDMGRVQDSYNNLGQEIDNLQLKSSEIEKEIIRYGEAMFSKMDNLQGKANEIDSKAGHSLDKQQELLDGQTKALEGLHSMNQVQSQALEESRNKLQELQEFAKGQHEKLLLQQDQLLQVHVQLAEKSRTILAAQEAFESKQANMLTVLDKLFALQKALLLESRLIKTCFIYCIAIFSVFMLTGATQTQTARFHLYMGLSITILIEIATLRFTSDDSVWQARLILGARYGYLIGSSLWLVYSFFTYRNYERENYKLLLTLTERVNELWSDEDEDGDVDWSSFVDEDLPDDVGYTEDPDYLLPEKVVYMSSPEKKYNLRRR